MTYSLLWSDIISIYFSQLENQLIYLKYFNLLICSLEDLMHLKYALVLVQKLSQRYKVSIKFHLEEFLCREPVFSML